ncbi:MAG: hypothetical protein J3K34DRAFT_266647 [Monoraphidium minutum]|nr:MAG: hypothetical protein J3K34DRAFT_266647 [Monoraphidium minutum]
MAALDEARTALAAARDEADALAAEGVLARLPPGMPAVLQAGAGAGAASASAATGLDLGLAAGVIREFAVAARMTSQLQAAQRKVSQLMGLLAATEAAAMAVDAQAELLARLVSRCEASRPGLAQLARLWQLEREEERLAVGGGDAGGPAGAPAGAPAPALPERAPAPADAGAAAEVAGDAPQQRPQSPRPLGWWPFKSGEQQRGGEAAAAAVPAPDRGTKGAVESAPEAGSRDAHTRGHMSRALLGWEGADACQQRIQASDKSARARSVPRHAGSLRARARSVSRFGAGQRASFASPACPLLTAPPLRCGATPPPQRAKLKAGRLMALLAQRQAALAEARGRAAALGRLLAAAGSSGVAEALASDVEAAHRRVSVLRSLAGSPPPPTA